MELTPTLNGDGYFNVIGGYKFDDTNEGVFIGKTDLDSMLDGSGFGAAPEMVVFALDKGPEISLVPEHYRTPIFTSSALVRSAAK